MVYPRDWYWVQHCSMSLFSDPVAGTEHALSKFPDDIKPGGVFDIPCCWAVIQRDLNKVKSGQRRAFLIQKRTMPIPAAGTK